MIFSLLLWLVYGLIVGLIVKAIYRGSLSAGFMSTVGIGIAGSFVGGLINYLLGGGGDPLQPSGFLMGIVGGIVACILHKKLNEL